MNPREASVEAGALDRAVEAMAETMYGPRAWGYADDDIQEPWRSDARVCIQAADDHLREHYWAEFREWLRGDEAFEVALKAVCNPDPNGAGGMIGRAQNVLAALATTQHKGGSQ